MSRVIPIALAAHLAEPVTSLAWAIVVTRADGQVYGFTSCDLDATVDTFSLAASVGLDVQSLRSTAGLAVDNTELTILADDDDTFTRDDIAAGRWDGAEFELFQYNWADPTDGRLTHKVGRFGNVQPRGEAFVVELRDVRQVLQLDCTIQTQETCRYRFCDVPATGVPSHCRLDAADYTEAVTVTAVASQSEFTDTARTEADDAFTEGLITWLTGLNAGLSVKVRAFAGGVFELATPMVFAIEVGDTADALLGCAKTREACKAYGNILNMGAEPDKRPINDLTTAPDF